MNGSLHLSPDEQSLARATKQAVQAAGGLGVCERETGISDTQLSRCCSRNHRDSITIRDAVTIEDHAHGQPGHPHILNAMARQLGFVVIRVPAAPEQPEGLMQSVMELTADLGALAQSVREALRDGEVNPEEAEDALEQLDALDQASAKLRLTLRGLARGGAA